MESRERFLFQGMAAELKYEAARLTGDRLMAAEARTEAAEARLCLTWYDIMDTAGVSGCTLPDVPEMGR